MSSYTYDKEIYTEYLVKNSLECICATDKEGNIVEFNPAAERVFGFTKEEIMELGASAIYANIEEFLRIFSELDKHGKYTGEVQNRRKNGEVFTSYLSANAWYGETGELMGTMGVSREVSAEPNLAEDIKTQNTEKRALKDEIEELSMIATSMTNGIVITDVEGRIHWCNQGFERISGYSENEIKGKMPSEIFRIPHFYQAEFKELTESGPNFDQAIQVPHYRKNGSLYWILVESTPVYDENGNLKQIIEVCTEITAQKNAELALIESEQNFRTISETIADAFYLYNLFEQQYEYMSPNCREVLGVNQDFFYSGDGFVKKMVHIDDRHIINKARLGVKNDRIYDIEYRITKKGKTHWIHERGYPIKDIDGKVVKASGVCTDITDEKFTQELIQRQNKDISESIEYAKLIQDATLPEVEEIRTIFQDSFVIYKPKGTLSGDFYIVDNIWNKKHKTMPVFLVADCTGHGVPGAILSILCNSLIKQTFTDHEVTSPGMALDKVREQLNRLFRTKVNEQMKDGMDISFCVFDEDRQILHFAGANSSCVILRDNEIIEIKGDKQHVGYSEAEHSFTDHSIQCEPGDNIYLFTDGFTDQFGGDRNKKYMRRHLLDFICKIGNKPMDLQFELIDREFENWKGSNEQTDDVCVLGIRI